MGMELGAEETAHPRPHLNFHSHRGDMPFSEQCVYLNKWTIIHNIQKETIKKHRRQGRVQRAAVLEGAVRGIWGIWERESSCGNSSIKALRF